MSPDLHQLEVADGLVELAPLVAVVERDVTGGLHQTDDTAVLPQRHYHSYYHNVITTALLSQRYYHGVIITTLLSQRYYQSVIITASLSQCYYRSVIITTLLSWRYYNGVIITAILSQHYYHSVIMTTLLSGLHQTADTALL